MDLILNPGIKPVNQREKFKIYASSQLLLPRGVIWRWCYIQGSP